MFFFFGHARVKIGCRCKKTYHTADYMTPTTLPSMENGVIHTALLTETLNTQRQEEIQQIKEVTLCFWDNTHTHSWLELEGKGENRRKSLQVLFNSAVSWGEEEEERLNRYSFLSESMSGITAVSHAQIHTAWNTQTEAWVEKLWFAYTGTLYMFTCSKTCTRWKEINSHGKKAEIQSQIREKILPKWSSRSFKHYSLNMYE